MNTNSRFAGTIAIVDLGSYVIEAKRRSAAPAQWKVYHNGRLCGKGMAVTVREAEASARAYVTRHQVASL